MYRSEFCDVHYDEQYNVVFVKWKKFCAFEDYRSPLSCALELMWQHDGCNYVADTTTGFENHPDDTKWVAEVFVPQAVKAGCTFVFFIIDENNSLQEELEGQEADSAGQIAFKYIYCLEDIERDNP